MPESIYANICSCRPRAAPRSCTPIEIARRLRQEVRERVRLPITVGIARTKFLAKVASAVAKPDGLLLVPPDGELDFLHPLPVERLWGVGPVTSTKLRDRGITTVRQVALLSEPALVAMLGQASGRHLHERTRLCPVDEVAAGARCAPRPRSGFHRATPLRRPIAPTPVPPFRPIRDLSRRALTGARTSAAAARHPELPLRALSSPASVRASRVGPAHARASGPSEHSVWPSSPPKTREAAPCDIT